MTNARFPSRRPLHSPFRPLRGPPLSAGPGRAGAGTPRGDVRGTTMGDNAFMPGQGIPTRSANAPTPAHDTRAALGGLATSVGLAGASATHAHVVHEPPPCTCTCRRCARRAEEASTAMERVPERKSGSVLCALDVALRTPPCKVRRYIRDGFVDMPAPPFAIGAPRRRHCERMQRDCPGVLRRCLRQKANLPAPGL